MCGANACVGKQSPGTTGQTDRPVISEPDNRVSGDEVAAGRPQSHPGRAKVMKSLSHVN